MRHDSTPSCLQHIDSDGAPVRDAGALSGLGVDRVTVPGRRGARPLHVVVRLARIVPRSRSAWARWPLDARRRSRSRHVGSQARQRMCRRRYRLRSGDPPHVVAELGVPLRCGNQAGNRADEPGTTAPDPPQRFRGRVRLP